MKYTLATIILFISMLLVSCGSNDESGNIIEESPKTSADAALPAGTNDNTSVSSSTPVLFVEDEDDNRVTLFENDNFIINFIVDKNYLSGETEYYYEYVIKTDLEKSPRISVTNTKINNSIPLADFSFWGDPKDGENSICNPIQYLEKELANNDVYSVKSISGKITSISHDYVRKDTYNFNVEIPTSLYERYFISPYMDALATTQTLCSDDTIDITLVAMGNFKRNNTSNYLHCVIKCTNKTDHYIPFKIESAVINGWCLSSANKVSHDISPGVTVYCEGYFYIPTDVNITSISSIDLLILTDDTENTSIDKTHKSGGKIYPVSLSKSGTATASKTEGNILYQSDKFTVYDDGYRASDNDLVQYFIIENNYSGIISYGCDDAKYNGENHTLMNGYLQSLDGSYLDLNPAFESIPPGTKYRGLAWIFPKNPTDTFTFSFNIYFYSAGGGKLIETSDRIEIKGNQ